MRALILSWEYPPLIEGGLARHVRKLAENLVAQDVEVHVLARGREESPAEEEMDGVLVHRVREPERPRELGEFVTWIERMNADMLAVGVEVGDRYDFDVVHGHDWLVASAGDHLANRFRAPFVVTIHATEYGRHQGWVDKHPQSYIHGVERWMANRAERLITCSAYMREHVADIYGLEESRITVIPNGIDPSELVPVDDLDALRARFAKPDERLVLLVGRLVYEKGFQLALEALPGLIERLGNVRFIVAGSGTAEQELREQATELGLDEYGSFLGWIGDDVLHSLYRIADLTVVPSIYEPFGLVALEAMASGCPCLVADTGGLREVVPNEDVGLRFRSRDPNSLGQMAERLLTDEELRDRLVAEASEHVLSFDWADVARQVAEVYGEVSSTRGPPRGAAGSARRSSSPRAPSTAWWRCTPPASTRRRCPRTRGRAGLPNGCARCPRCCCTKAAASHVDRHRPVRERRQPDRGGEDGGRLGHLRVVAQQVGREGHQRDQRQEQQVHRHERAVEPLNHLEQAVVDDPEPPDEREREGVGAERRDQVVEARRELRVGNRGNLDVQDEQRDRHRHHPVREGGDPRGVGVLHAGS